jgi:SAM-dependent methyltransferase
MQLTDPTDQVAEFDRYLSATFDRRQGQLRLRCRGIHDADSLREAREFAWEALRDVFAAWYHVERGVEAEMDPRALIAIRDRVREQARFTFVRHANFPDATRLLSKAYPIASRLERPGERNPGAPPALDALYLRRPFARGDFPIIDRTFIEVLDHAFLQLREIDAVHDRTRAAVRILVPRILQRLSAGQSYTILDVACGGNQLARHLSEALRSTGCIKGTDLSRIGILGVDVDPRALPYTYQDSGLGWHEVGRDPTLDVVIGNLLDPRTQDEIKSWISKRESSGFDAVTALGIFDYIGCAVPGEDRVYIPEKAASAFGDGMRSTVRRGGVLIAAVFAEEGFDDVSAGARHLFANWHIEHATAARMLDRFPFLHRGDFQSLTAGRDALADEMLHFIVHEVS